MSCLKERGFRDRDFLSTKEGFFFCVVGPYHPNDRVISYLKYLPDPGGKWRKARDRFKRVMQAYTIPSLLETFEQLKNGNSQYLFFSPVYKITMSAVPLRRINEHFKPEKKLAELLKEPRLDSLQKRVVHFTSILSELSGIAKDNLGITGSVLLAIHNPAFSDMDITVYGTENSYTVKNALTKAYSTKNLGVKPFEKEKIRKWCKTKARNHPISLNQAERIYKRKWNIGTFEGTAFSLHPIKLERELEEKYGDKTYYPVGTVTLRAVVADSRDSIFLPAVYQAREVEVEDEAETSIERIVSYEGLYGGLAETDEMIEAKGKLEHVINNRTGRRYDRVLVGSPEGRGEEYIMPI